MPLTIGIPPHGTHLHKINTIKDCCKVIKATVLEFKRELRDSISQAIDVKVEESGGINDSILDSLISKQEKF